MKKRQVGARDRVTLSQVASSVRRIQQASAKQADEYIRLWAYKSFRMRDDGFSSLREALLSKGVRVGDRTIQHWVSVGLLFRFSAAWKRAFSKGDVFLSHCRTAKFFLKRKRADGLSERDTLKELDGLLPLAKQSADRAFDAFVRGNTNIVQSGVAGTKARTVSSLLSGADIERLAELKRELSDEAGKPLSNGDVLSILIEIALNQRPRRAPRRTA